MRAKPEKTKRKMYGYKCASLHKIPSYDHENANESFSQLYFHKVLFIESENKSLKCELVQGTMHKLCSYNMLVYVWFFS